MKSGGEHGGGAWGKLERGVRVDMIKIHWIRVWNPE